MNMIDRETLKKLNRVINVDNIFPLEESKNKNFLVSSKDGLRYVLKIYRESTSQYITNQEILSYSLLAGKNAIKKMICKGEEFILTEYFEGIQLDAYLLEDKGQYLEKIMHQIIQFIDECHNYTGYGFGGFNYLLNGEEKDWKELLLRFIDDLYATIECEAGSIFEVIRTYLVNYIYNNEQYFRSVKSRMIPIDLNLKNVIVNKNGKIKFIDLESMWLGDELLPYGELLAHIYGGRLYGSFLKLVNKKYFTSFKIIHFYSLLSLFAIMVFANQNCVDIKDMKPFGNDNKVIDLISSHMYIMSCDDIGLRHRVCSCDLIAEEGMASKKDGLSQHSAYSIDKRIIDNAINKTGITRIYDITGLDRIGVKTIQATRPDAEEGDGSFTVFSGKGIEDEQCKMSAIMEAIERFCAEEKNNRDRFVRLSINQAAEYELIYPEEFNCVGHIPRDLEMDWIYGYDLLNMNRCLVPAANVCYPYDSKSNNYPVRNYTTGLAAGGSYIDAITHGLCEVIERDAAAMNLIFREGKSIDEKSIDCAEILKLIEYIRSNNNLELYIKYITTAEISIPVFQVIIDDIEKQDPMFISGGYGAHPNKSVALLNAINEAIVSRLGTISGAREDLKKFSDSKDGITYKDYKDRYGTYWFRNDDSFSFSSVESYAFPTVIEDLFHICQELYSNNFSKIIIVDLMHDDIGIPVVKCLVPGLERYSFHMKSFGVHAIKHKMALESIPIRDEKEL